MSYRYKQKYRVELIWDLEDGGILSLYHNCSFDLIPMIEADLRNSASVVYHIDKTPDVRKVTPIANDYMSQFVNTQETYANFNGKQQTLEKDMPVNSLGIVTKFMLRKNGVSLNQLRTSLEKLK